MAGKTNVVPKLRKRVEAETPSASASTLKRARDGSAFARCEECKSSVPVALIDMHSCSLEARIKMTLESQVVEKPAEAQKKPSESKKKPTAPASTTESKTKKRKLTKAKDPNKPKRPLSAYFLFLEDFRKTFKENNPDSKGVKELGKEAGEKWRSMSDEEKKPYLDKAAELKAEYDKVMDTYQAENVDQEEEQQAKELCDENA